MAHVHDADNDTYYLDQLCLILICAAFGGVCLLLYFWQTEMLARLLAPQFHLFVLLSGIGLLTLVAVRSVTLWREAGARAKAASHAHHHHDHAHEHHHHDHDHENCGHDHDHAHAAAVPHEHAHHDHGHSHDDGHDHSWAPWRYVVLLIPIMLFLLGLPNRGLTVQAAHLDTTNDVVGWTGLAALGPSPLGQAAALAVLQIDPGAVEVKILLDDQPAQLSDLKPGMPVVIKRTLSRKFVEPAVELVRVGKGAEAEPADHLTVAGKVASVKPEEKELTVVQSDGKEKTFDLGQGPIYQIDFKALEALAFNEVTQREWAGRTVRVLAQFAPQGDRFFTLARYRIQCCGADAVQVSIPALLSRGSLLEIPTHPQQNGWVRVTGRVEFREQRGSSGKKTMLVIPRPKDIEESPPDPNPYIP